MIVASADALIVHPANASEPDAYYTSPRITWLSQSPSFPYYGELIYVEDKLPSVNVSGRIVLYKSRSGQSKDQTAQLLQDYDILVLIIEFLSYVDYPGIGNFARLPNYHPRNKFPVVEVTMSQSGHLQEWIKNQTNGSVFVTVTDDPNPWRSWADGPWTILSWILLVFTIPIFYMAVYKLVLLVLRDGFQFSVGQSVLALNIFALAIRMLWCLIDPWGMYERASTYWVQIGMTVPVAASFGSSLLIALYWHEMMNRFAGSQHSINQFLGKMKWPFFAFTFFMSAFELFTSCARAAQISTDVLYLIDGLVYAIVALGMAVFFVVTKIRLDRLLSRMQKEVNISMRRSSAHPEDLQQSAGAVATRRFERATQLVFAIACSLVIYIVVASFIAFMPAFWIPAPFFAIWTVIFLTHLGNCLCQVMLIRAPARSWRWILCGLWSQVSIESSTTSEHVSANGREAASSQTEYLTATTYSNRQ